MNYPTPISTAQALKLRAQALECLRKAEQLDGLKAYGLLGCAPMTSSVFWSATIPNEDVAGSIYAARQEENDGAVKPIALEDICGLSAISRSDGQEPA